MFGHENCYPDHRTEPQGCCYGNRCALFDQHRRGFAMASGPGKASQCGLRGDRHPDRSTASRPRGRFLVQTACTAGGRMSRAFRPITAILLLFILAFATLGVGSEFARRILSSLRLPSR